VLTVTRVTPTPRAVEALRQDMRAMMERGRPDYVCHPPSPDAAR